MNKRVWRVSWEAVAWISINLICALPAFSLDHFRVYHIEPDSFDYTFTAYAGAGDRATSLSFNHRNGQTFFVHVGERLGEYVVVRFEPATDQVFDPTLNVTLKVKSGKATLQGPDGRTVVLEMGKPGLLSGFRALIVSLQTGGQWSVRAGDTFSEADAVVIVTAISDSSVTVNINDEPEVRIPLASDDEKIAVALLWKRQREKREKQQAEQLAIVSGQEGTLERPVIVINPGQPQGGQVTSAARSEPTLFVGTEYRYPTEYEVWLARQGPDGRIRPLVIPKKFETRTIGGGIGPGPNFTWTSGCPAPGSLAPPPISPMVHPPSRFHRIENRVNR